MPQRFKRGELGAYVGFRLPPAHQQKLTALAQARGERLSDVLRALVDGAVGEEKDNGGASGETKRAAVAK